MQKPRLTPRQMTALSNLKDNSCPSKGLGFHEAERMKHRLVELGLMIAAEHPRFLPRITELGVEVLAAEEAKAKAA